MHKVALITLIFISSILFADAYDPLDIDFLKKQPKKEEVKPEGPKPPDKKPEKKDEFPAYDEVIKEMDIIKGLFNFYWDKKKNKLFISLEPEDFDTIYLANLTRKSGDATYYDSGNMLW